MQIEFVGCTSAGKSTLIKKIQHDCSHLELDILLAHDFALRQIRLNWLKNQRLRRLLLNLVGLCASLVTWRKNLEFYHFVVQLLFELPISPLVKFYSLRNVLKRIGIYEIIRSYSRDGQIVLVDEGTLQTAHNLFVHVSEHMKTENLSTFAGLIPLPDVVFYVKQREALLIDRIMKRGHKRIPVRSVSNVAHFVEQAVVTFDGLVQCPEVENSVLIVDGLKGAVMAASHAHEQDGSNMELALKIIRCSFADYSTV